MVTAREHRSGYVVVGVDTHKDIHVAAVMDTLVGIVGTLTIPTNTRGFAALENWAAAHGKIIAFGIEGTGSPKPPPARPPATCRCPARQPTRGD